jgi:hypothetical protein
MVLKAVRNSEKMGSVGKTQPDEIRTRGSADKGLFKRAATVMRRGFDEQLAKIKIRHQISPPEANSSQGPSAATTTQSHHQAGLHSELWGDAVHGHLVWDFPFGSRLESASNDAHDLIPTFP